MIFITYAIQPLPAGVAIISLTLGIFTSHTGNGCQLWWTFNRSEQGRVSKTEWPESIEL